MTPIENKMARHLTAMIDTLGWNLQAQVRIGPYTADFVVEVSGRRYVIECDGHTYHDRTDEQATKDRIRDRWFLRNGCQTIRFSSTEIFENAERCATETIRTISNALEGRQEEVADAFERGHDSALIAQQEVLVVPYGSNGLHPLRCPLGNESCVGGSGDNFCGSYLGDRIAGDRHLVRCSEVANPDAIEPEWSFDPE